MSPLGSSLAGAGLFRLLQNSGQIDLVIGFLYVMLLGGIGGLMLKDALTALGWVEVEAPKERPRHNRWIAALHPIVAFALLGNASQLGAHLRGLATSPGRAPSHEGGVPGTSLRHG